MADGTGIEWTDATWNPLRGCSRVSEGCRNCYAERVAARFSGEGQPYEGLATMTPAGARWTNQVRLIESALEQPLKWRRPRRIFVNSMSDLFHESVPDEWINRVFAVMSSGTRHVFQVLTKRPERMKKYVTAAGWKTLPNVWLGVSVEDQETANKRIPHLLATPAAIRFISAEPLLGSVGLDNLIDIPPRSWGLSHHINALAGHRWDESELFGSDKPYEDDPPNTNRLDWVIVGGESGPGARPMHPDWARSLRDQCVDAGVPFFFKQWGEHDAAGQRVGKAKAGCTLDGKEWRQFPKGALK